MTAESTSNLALIEAIALPPTEQNSKQARTAVRRCTAAWKRAYDAYMENSKGSGMDQVFAAHKAGPAYRRALPPLAGYENIRDFIACVAHGILIDAIPQNRASQLLYAAQIALATLNCEPKSRKSA